MTWISAPASSVCQFSNEPQSPPSIDVGLQVSFSIEFTNAESTNTDDQWYLSPSVFLLCISGAVSLFTGPLGALKDTTQVWLSTQCPGEHPPGEVAMVTALAGLAVAVWWCWAIQSWLAVQTQRAQLPGPGLCFQGSPFSRVSKARAWQTLSSGAPGTSHRDVNERAE